MIKGKVLENRMCFPSTDAELRSDANFRQPNVENEAEFRHIKDYSILQELPIDMVKSFVVADSLHLLELGNMKKYKEFCIAMMIIVSFFQCNLFSFIYKGPLLDG